MGVTALELDTFDLRILELLQENNQLTSQQISDQVHLSPVSCLRRIRRMRDEGVIVKDVSIVSPEHVGRRMMLIVLVSLERERRDIVDEFRRTMVGTPEVMQCMYVTGDADFVLQVTTRTMAEYEAFTQRFFFQNPHVKRFNTMVVMSQVKFGTAIPLDGTRGGT